MSLNCCRHSLDTHSPPSLLSAKIPELVTVLVSLTKVMDILGFSSEYVVHGGDSGSDTAKVLGARQASCKMVCRDLPRWTALDPLIDAILVIHSMLLDFFPVSVINRPL
jgi:hypothetical protein